MGPELAIHNAGISHEKKLLGRRAFENLLYRRCHPREWLIVSLVEILQGYNTKSHHDRGKQAL